MISAGIASTQKRERSALNGQHPRNGTGQSSQYIKRITAPFQRPDLKPSADPGSRPEVQWIPKTLLYVDARYQRQATTRRSHQLIRRMVEGFAWSKFQPITVAEIQEGSIAGHFAVIDGQHRAIAALSHPRVDEVPCWVINAADVGTQAVVFVSVNRDRTNIQPLQLYRAQLAAQDKEALRIDRVCGAAGVSFAYHLSGSDVKGLPPRQTQAVSTLRHLLTVYGDEIVLAALKALVAAFPDAPGQLRGQMIEAVAMIYAKHRGRIDTAHFVHTLAERDCEEFIDDARNYKKLMGGGTKAAMVAALIKAYDKGRAQGAGIAKLGGKVN